MAATPSRRLGLHGPAGGDPARVPADVVRLRDQLDELALGYDQGVLSARPTAGTEGRMYYATDDGALYYDMGTGWVPAAWQPGDVRWSAAVARPPVGWLACDGSTVLRAGYPALFAAIGVAHGAGDGSTTFALPDLRGRSAIGPAEAGRATGISARTLGQLVGAETHTHTTSAHTHTVPAHLHSIAGGAAGGMRQDLSTTIPTVGAGGQPFLYFPAGPIGPIVNTDSGGSGSTGSSGGGSTSSGSAMQPSTVLQAWIKT